MRGLRLGFPLDFDLFRSLFRAGGEKFAKLCSVFGGAGI
jgi:hypothetical protein